MTIPSKIEIETKPTDINISDLFSVNLTSYGGRACFAKQDIPAGTNVLVTNDPIGSVVLYEFRKEVCSMCLKYEYGETCKVKLDTSKGRKKFQGAGLWFCSSDCKDQYLERDDAEQLVEVFESLLEQYQIKAKNPVEHPDDYNPQISRRFIDEFWSEVDEWEAKVSKLKKTKVMNQIPYINEDEYTTVRFAALALFNLYKGHESTPYYNDLQSNEFDKISKFPILLLSQAAVFKFLRIVLPDYLQRLLSTETFRLLCGREYGNSFGIWQQTSLENANENKEFLGYSLYAEASYFNHSCEPNVKKFRIKNKMCFQTTSDVNIGEQLCIDYFHILDEPLEERQKVLKQNWFFECGCSRCQREKAELV